MSQEQREFKGYNEDQMKRIASKLGHTGGLDTFDTYLTSNQNALSKYNALKDNIKKMYAGGYVNKYAVGGDVTGQVYYKSDQARGGQGGKPNNNNRIRDARYRSPNPNQPVLAPSLTRVGDPRPLMVKHTQQKIC